MITVFMDLQGTLGGDPVGDISNFEFYPEAVAGLKCLNQHQSRLIVVTNQSRISKGHLTWETYETKVSDLKSYLKQQGISEVEFYCCPHDKSDQCHCKKPLLGLYEQALAKMPVDLSRAFMIGDMGMSDMLFAHRLGIKKILVLTGVGAGSLTAYRHTWDETDPEYVANDFLAAANWIVTQK